MITEIDIKDKAMIRACSIVETSGTELNVLFLEETQIRCLQGSCSIWTSRKFSRQLHNAISPVKETEDQWCSVSYQNLEKDGPTQYLSVYTVNLSPRLCQRKLCGFVPQCNCAFGAKEIVRLLREYWFCTNTDSMRPKAS